MNYLRNKAQRFLVLLSCALFVGVCASAASAKELNGYYEGTDGGAYFIRQIGDKVYWFGEDPGGKWANVMRGTIVGNRITATFWDVPKGRSQATGEINLEIQGDGDGLVKISSSVPFGAQSWKRDVNRTESRSRPQGFSDPQTLTGVWEGDDYAAYYVRETPAGDVVWVAENGFWGGPGGYPQPAFVNVFFGKRIKQAIIGNWVDLPKGKATNSGVLNLSIISPQEVNIKSNSVGMDATKLWRSLPNNLRGFADLHAHPMVNLGFGGKLIHGGPDIGSLLPADADCNHNVQAKSIGQALGRDNSTHGGGNLLDSIGFTKANPCGDNFRELFIDVFQGQNNAANTPTNAMGYPSFKDWPIWSDISHQKMWIDWVRRSYDGGQRVMIALAVHNSTLAAAASGPGDGPTDDKTSADLQIDEIKKFVHRHDDFMEVAYSAADVRRIVAANKMAIVLGVEIDNIGNFNKLPRPLFPGLISYEIKRLYDKGVRYVFPVHVLDNAFGHTAAYETLFNYSNRRESGKWWDLVCSSYEDEITYKFEPIMADQPKEIKSLLSILSQVKVSLDLNAPKPPECGKYGHKNRGGLTDDGRLAIKEMMKLGMLIDIDHMSQNTANQTLDLAESIFNKYPLISGHNNLRSISTSVYKEERQIISPNENSRTDDQLKRIGRLGGMFGLGSAHVGADDWAERYVIASHLVGYGGVSFGTDLNGLVRGMVPDSSANIYTSFFPMSKTGDKSWDLRRDGVAHYGLLADFVRDISLKEKNGVFVSSHLMDNAEYFARMWEKAEHSSKTVK